MLFYLEKAVRIFISQRGAQIRSSSIYLSEKDYFLFFIVYFRFFGWK